MQISSSSSDDDVADSDENVTSWTAFQYLGRRIPEPARLSPCFESSVQMHEVMNFMGDTLHSVDSEEHEHLNQTVALLLQFLMLMASRPSKEHGEELRRYLQHVRESVTLRGRWPKGPTQDPRIGTVLESVAQLVFEHPEEGLIHLQWVNPLPLPSWMQAGGYMCDVCTEGLLLGYQHVNEDNTRDHSSFQLHRIGYDVCTPCAVKHISDNRMKVSSWLNNALQGLSEPLIRCGSQGLLEPELCLHAQRIGEQSGSTLGVAINIRGTAGLYVSVVVLPVDGDGICLPDGHCWLSMGTSLSENSANSNLNITDGSVQFVCAEGSSWNIKAGDKRGILICSFCMASGLESPGDATIKAVSYREGNLSQSKPNHFLSLKGFDVECKLPFENSSEILSELHALASRCGVVHNIPRQAALTDSSSSASVAMADGSKCPQVGENVGTASDFLVSDTWATTSDCTICCAGLGDDTWIRGLPMKTSCGHFFHAKCLKRCYRIDSQRNDDTGACPNCRTKDPLNGAEHVGGLCSRSWNLYRDVLGRALSHGHTYMVAAVLCQDPQAVVDSGLMFRCEPFSLD